MSVRFIATPILRPGVSSLTAVVLAGLLIVLPRGTGLAADGPRSLALKDRSPQKNPFHVQPDRSADELWDEFMLMQNANSGDPVAQHQLGLRYLMGNGFPADTSKAALWIGRAAARNLVTARYNFGILLNNGWGITWNPFEAYRQIQYAALHGLTEAEYVYGLFMTDNLIVGRDDAQAFRWIKAAADSGYAPATETLAEFERRGITGKLREEKRPPSVKQPATPRSTIQPVYLDVTRDSVEIPKDRMLIDELLNERRELAGNRDTLQGHESADTTMVMAALASVRAEADAGCPEALVLLARSFQERSKEPPDLIEASVYYLRAIRFDSPWAPLLLWGMIHSPDYFTVLKRGVDIGDVRAEFVWAGLSAIGFDRQLTDRQALEMLEKAASGNYPDALVQLALCRISGYWTGKDRAKAVRLLGQARDSGSQEAALRLAMFDIMENGRSRHEQQTVHYLRTASEKGSVLAEAVLGYCFERGVGTGKSLPQAVHYYRKAAQRGCRIAVNALRRLYDERRPADAEFQITEEE